MSLASYMAGILKDKYVFANAIGKKTNNGWYYFDGTFWKRDTQQINLRRDFSTVIIENYIVDRRLIGESDESISKTVLKLKDKLFKDRLVLAVRDYFSDEGFVKRLDADQNLIAFTNGVWELDSGTFRKAKREDYLTTSFTHAFVAEVNVKYRELVMGLWETLYPKRDEMFVAIKTFALKLCGYVGRSLYHRLYMADTEGLLSVEIFTRNVINDDLFKMEFVRVLLDNYV